MMMDKQHIEVARDVQLVTDFGAGGGWSHLVSAAAGGSHGRHEQAVIHAAEGVLAVIPGGDGE